MPPQELTFGDWNTDTATSTNIQITNNGDTFTLESQLQNNAVAQWDAQTLTANDGDTITNLPDSVGAFDLTDGSGLTYQANGINGNPSLLSNGSTDELGRNSFGQQFTQPYSISGIIKMETQNSTNQALIGFFDSGGGTSGTVWGDRTSGDRIIFSGSTLSGGAADTTVIAFVAVFNGASSVFNVDGVESTGDAGTREIANNMMRIGTDAGASSYANALHGEYVLYNAALDSTQRADEIDRLQTTWA